MTTTTAPRLVKRTGEDESADRIVYDVYVGDERIGNVRRGRERPSYSGIGMTYYPWEGWSIHKHTSADGRTKGQHTYTETRRRAVAFVIRAHEEQS